MFHNLVTNQQGRRVKTNDDFCAYSGMEIYTFTYIRIWDLSVNSSGFLNGPLVQKIRYFMAGSGSGSKDFDLLNPSGLMTQVTKFDDSSIHYLLY